MYFVPPFLPIINHIFVCFTRSSISSTNNFRPLFLCPTPRLTNFPLLLFYLFYRQHFSSQHTSKPSQSNLFSSALSVILQLPRICPFLILFNLITSILAFLFQQLSFVFPLFFTTSNTPIVDTPSPVSQKFYETSISH